MLKIGWQEKAFVEKVTWVTWVSKCFTPRNYNPRDIIRNCRRLLKKESLEPMLPWYRGFRGNIAQMPEQEGRFEPLGSFVETGGWFQSYKYSMFSIFKSCYKLHVLTGKFYRDTYNSWHVFHTWFVWKYDTPNWIVEMRTTFSPLNLQFWANPFSRQTYMKHRIPKDRFLSDLPCLFFSKWPIFFGKYDELADSQLLILFFPHTFQTNPHRGTPPPTYVWFII